MLQIGIFNYQRTTNLNNGKCFEFFLFPIDIKRIPLQVSQQMPMQYAEIKLGLKYQLWILVSIIKPFCIGNI